jgi:phosphomannomutase
MSHALDHIFKAYDIRGKVGTELTPEVMTAIGRALADWLPTEGAVAVGRDMRPDSGELAEAVISGLRQQGRDVIDIGEVTTDMIYFAVGDLKLAGGAMVTASHNPGEYNGVKLCGEAARPVGINSGLAELRDKALDGNFQAAAAQEGKRSEKDIVEGWVQHVLSFIDTDKLKPLKLAVDAGNGMAGKIFPELEPYVPWEVSEMYFELDGTFPNHEANPMKFETLHDMIEVIKKDKLYGGIAFDGDGDRAFLVDETGAVLSGGVMSALLAEYFLKLHPGAAIVYDIRNSHSVPDVVTEQGGKPIMTRVGHAYIKQVMRENDAPFGGEASGHFYFRDNWYADSGLLAVVIGVYVATLSGEKLSVLRQRYTRYAAIPETNFVVEDKEAALQRIAAAFPDKPQNPLDGLTVTLNDSNWFNVRPSNTESVMRLNAEAKTQAELDELVAKVIALIKGE